MKYDKTRVIDIWIDPGLRKEVIEAASAEERSASSFVRKVMKEHLDSAESGRMISLPHTKDNGKKCVMMVNLDRDVRGKLETAAGAERRTLAGFISKAVKEYLQKRTVMPENRHGANRTGGKHVDIMLNLSGDCLKMFAFNVSKGLRDSLFQMAAEDGCSTSVLIDRILQERFASEYPGLSAECPAPMKKTKRVKVSIRAKASTIERLEALSKEDERTLSEYVYNVLAKYLSEAPKSAEKKAADL